MYPILFKVGPLDVTTYYVLWAAALFLMITWTRRRAVSMYGMTFGDATDVLLWMIFGVFIGAMLGGYLANWTKYAGSPAKILNFWESGVSSGPGFIGGGLAGLYKLKRLKVSPNAFAEAAAVPCAFMLFVGRWGCFLNGCCLGIRTDSPWGVAFPFAPSVRVFPTQLFESFAALAIGMILVITERKLGRSPRNSQRGAFLMPIFLLLYGAYRFFFDFLRAGDRILGLRLGQYTGAIACVVGIVWFICSFRNSRAKNVVSASDEHENLH
ncbi:MAG: prolipoprotein diacylglyceryl transferase [Synergistaceae bacterium]|jgi:phosphatidylglycerol:prolipoprotein diacylglycerol transferase|nr:prolipoprotein diacylglyceryl transferase [Synergistaceae bacterium]